MQANQQPKQNNPAKWTTPAAETTKRNPADAALINQISITQLLQHLGSITAGAEGNTDCPLHDSQDHSCLHYDNLKKTWFCHHAGCEQGGTIIELAAKATNRTLKQTREYLAENFECQLPDDKYTLPVDDATANIVLRHVAAGKEGRPQATEIMAETFRAENRIYTTRKDEHAEMWVYIEGIYKPQGRTYIRSYVRQILREAYTAQLLNEVILKVEADTFIEQEELFKEEPPELICLQNGIFNLNTAELTPHTPDRKFFNKIPVTYKAESECPAIKAFLNDVLTDEKDILGIQEFFGFCLYRDYFMRKAFMLTGRGGNGKGVLLHLLGRFLGEENITELNLKKMEEDNFEISNLHKKFANISADIGRELIEENPKFKSLTGRDIVVAKRKFLSTLQFENYAKMIFACNELPSIKDRTPAMLDRWILIKFPFSFVPQKIIDQLSPLEKAHTLLKPENQNILEEIVTEEELSGLFNWATEGLKRLKENKQFSNTPTTKGLELEWARLGESVTAFVLDCCAINENVEIMWTAKERFINEYTRYCRSKKLRIQTNKEIRLVLEDRFGVFSRRHRINDWEVECWQDLILKQVEQPDNVMISKSSSVEKPSEEQPGKPAEEEVIN